MSQDPSDFGRVNNRESAGDSADFTEEVFSLAEEKKGPDEIAPIQKNKVGKKFYRSGWFKALVPLVLFVALTAIFTNREKDDSFFMDNDKFISSAGGNDDIIGLIELKGVILDSKPYLKQINSAEKNENIKALLIHVDSPGGAVASSQEVYEAVRKLNSEKPVYVSMENLAASGGYYAVLGSKNVYANLGTLTGSIGVIIQNFNYGGLMEKIGVEAITFKSGERKDILSPFRQISPEESAIIQELIDDSYRDFVAAVAEGRDIELDKAMELADGRIYTGRQALDAGLIDGIKTYNQVIEQIKNDLDLKNAKIQNLRRWNNFDYFLDQLDIKGLQGSLGFLNRMDALSYTGPLAIMEGYY